MNHLGFLAPCRHASQRGNHPIGHLVNRVDCRLANLPRSHPGSRHRNHRHLHPCNRRRIQLANQRDVRQDILRRIHLRNLREYLHHNHHRIPVDSHRLSQP